jgi:predicted SAM-dependent methyltransferase
MAKKPHPLKAFFKHSALLTWLVRSLRHGWLWPRKRERVMRQYLAKHPQPKLHLGTGPDYQLDESWLASDLNPLHDRGIVYLDASKPFPFPDATFDYVFSEHLVEHLTYPQGEGMLRECFRVLKPGGRIRVGTPDLRVFIALFAETPSEVQQEYIRYHVDKFLKPIGIHSPVFVLNNIVRNWGHQFMYDEQTLRDAIEKAGFTDLKRYASGESDDPALKGLEFHGKVVKNEAMNAHETMVIEARKGR